jgi:hypothetical protein
MKSEQNHRIGFCGSTILARPHTQKQNKPNRPHIFLRSVPKIRTSTIALARNSHSIVVATMIWKIYRSVAQDPITGAV